MNDHLLALRLFARVARVGSFTAAGRELGISQSSASRVVAALEQRIGARLFVRNTRALALTTEGVDFLARIEDILAELDEAEQTVRGAAQIKGRLRVGLGSSLAVREVIPRLPDFLARYAGLHVDLLIDEKRQDLVAEGIDVALRFGPIAGSTVTSKVMRAWPRVLAASPEYLRLSGVPLAPSDLPAHSIIVGPTSTGPTWSLTKGGATESIRVDGRTRITGNESAIAAAVAGLGIVMTSSGSLRREFEEGQLTRVIPDWDLGAMELSAVFVAGRAAKRAARVFIDYLVEVLPRP